MTDLLHPQAAVWKRGLDTTTPSVRESLAGLDDLIRELEAAQDDCFHNLDRRLDVVREEGR